MVTRGSLRWPPHLDHRATDYRGSEASAVTISFKINGRKTQSSGITVTFSGLDSRYCNRWISKATRHLPLCRAPWAVLALSAFLVYRKYRALLQKIGSQTQNGHTWPPPAKPQCHGEQKEDWQEMKSVLKTEGKWSGRRPHAGPPHLPWLMKLWVTKPWRGMRYPHQRPRGAGALGCMA